MPKLIKTFKEARVEEVKVARKAFKVKKVFAEWVVILNVHPDDNYDSLLRKAIKEIDDKRIMAVYPQHDHELEEIKRVEEGTNG